MTAITLRTLTRTRGTRMVAASSGVAGKLVFEWGRHDPQKRRFGITSTGPRPGTGARVMVRHFGSVERRRVERLSRSPRNGSLKGEPLQIIGPLDAVAGDRRARFEPQAD